MAVSTFRAHCSISHPRIDFAGAEGAAALAAHIKTCKPPVNPHYSKAYNARFLSQRLPGPRGSSGWCLSRDHSSCRFRSCSCSCSCHSIEKDPKS